MDWHNSNSEISADVQCCLTNDYTSPPLTPTLPRKTCSDNCLSASVSVSVPLLQKQKTLSCFANIL